jgi:hypothetical protein
VTAVVIVLKGRGTISFRPQLWDKDLGQSHAMAHQENERDLQTRYSSKDCSHASRFLVSSEKIVIVMQHLYLDLSWSPSITFWVFLVVLFTMHPSHSRFQIPSGFICVFVI